MHKRVVWIISTLAHILPCLILVLLPFQGMLSFGLIIPVEVLVIWFNTKHLKGKAGRLYIAVMQVGVTAGMLVSYLRYPVASHPEALGGAALFLAIIVNLAIVLIAYGFLSAK